MENPGKILPMLRSQNYKELYHSAFKTINVTWNYKDELLCLAGAAWPTRRYPSRNETAKPAGEIPGRVATLLR